jgi:hypothetical protein
MYKSETGGFGATFWKYLDGCQFRYGFIAIGALRKE